MAAQNGGKTRSGSVQSAKESSKCAKCKKSVKKNDSGLACEICETWYHAECVSMSEDEFRDFEKNEVGQKMHWFCPDCEKGTLSMLKTVKRLEQRQSKLEEETEKVKASVQDQNKKIDEQNVKIDVIEKNIDKRIDAKVEDRLSEDKEREKRSLNIIIHNIEEPGASLSSQQKIVTDLRVVSEVMAAHMDMEVEVTECIRLGKPREGPGKPRPLRIRVKDQNTKSTILRNSPKLKSVPDPKVNSIFINPDLTLMQRDDDKKLRDECKSRRDAGEDVIIRAGKVIPRYSKEKPPDMSA